LKFPAGFFLFYYRFLLDYQEKIFKRLKPPTNHHSLLLLASAAPRMRMTEK